MDPFTALKILFYVGSGVASYKSYKKAKKLEKQANQLLIQKYGTGGGIPVSYGTRRVAGTVLYANTINNRELFVVYAISVGEIHNISNIKIGGRSVADTSVFDHFIQRNTNYFGSTQAELDRILANQDPPNKPRMVFNCHLGAADQVADPMLVGCVPEWTSAHRLKGIAYIACNFDYDSGGGMFTGLPEITCDVQGKKIYDPRLDSTVTNGSGSQRINDPSTFAFTNNTPLVLLDYLTNSEYGKALPTSAIDMQSFITAANKNITQQTFTYSATLQSLSTDGSMRFKKTTANLAVYTALKVGNPITIKIGSTTYASGTVIGKTSNSRADRLEDEYEENHSEYQEPRETLYVIQLSSGAVTTEIGFNPTAVSIDITSTQDRFPFNGVIDTEETVFDNAKKILANMRGIFNYINGIYSLKIEDSESVTLSIGDDDILQSGIKVEVENKEQKYNIVEVEFANAQKDYELDTATYKHTSATTGQDYTYDDGGEELKLTIEMPYITNHNIVYQNAKAILLRSRNNKTISFTGTHKLLYAKVGELISITNSRLGMAGEQYRITKMTINNDLTVSVNAIIYQSNIYGYVTPPDENIEIPDDMVDSFKSDTPTNLNFVDKDPTTGVQPYLTWTNPTTYPAYEFRVIVKDSNNNVKYDGRTKNNFFNLTGLEVDNGYTAEVKSLNTNYVESQAATYNFNNSVPPVQNDDLGTGSVTDAKVADISADKIDTGVLNLGTEPGMAVRQAKTSYSSTATGFWLGNDGGTPKFNIGTSTNYLQFDGSNLQISGNISATTGTIGGFTVGNNYLRAGTGTTRISLSTVDGIHLGNNTFASAPFKVALNGDLTATSATVTGNITATSLNVTNASVTGTLDASVITVNGEVLSTLVAYGTTTGQDGNFFKINNQLDLEGKFYWNASGNTNYFYLGNGDEDDVSLYITSSASNAIVLGDEANALGSFKIRYGNDINATYNDSFIELDGDWTTGHVSSGTPETTYTISGETTITNPTVGIKAKTTTPLKLYFSSDANQNDLSRVELSKTTIAGSTTTPVVVVTQGSAPSTTTNKLYNIGGSLYWNGAIVDTGAGDITGVTITTSGQSGLTGGASFSSGDATFTLAIAGTISGSKTFSDDVVVQGDLTVEGTTTTIDTTNLDVQDKNITLNYGSGDTSANANGAGITIQDAVSATQDATLTWNTANDSFNFSHPLNVTGAISTTGSITSTDGTLLLVDDSGDQPKIQFSESDVNHFILEYNGTGSGVGNYVAFYSEFSGWVTKGNGLNYVPANGRVGIGLSNPSEKLSVVGNISVTGTVDGRDIATDGTKLDGIEAGATTDQTQAEINALGITAIGLSGTPNITVGTINSGAITSSGDVTTTGHYIADTHFRSSDSNVTLSATGGGGVFLRPDGNGNSANQVFIASGTGNATFAGSVYVGTATTNGGVINLLQSGSNPEIRIQGGEGGDSLFSIYNTATNPDAEQFFINNTLGSSHLGNKRGALKLESSSGVVLTLGGTSATFAGELLLEDANTKLFKDSSNRLQIQTNNGYTQIGAGNSAYNHFMTDRSKNYFNKRIIVDEGIVSSYNEDLVLQRSQSTVATFTTTGATFANDVSVTSELSVGQLITASGGITTDQTGQTISGFSTIRVGDALIGQDVATLTTTSASQTNRILASATTYRTLKVLVQIKSGTNFHATEILLTHDGTTVYMTEYATIFSNSSLAFFDADISGGNIRLLIDPNQSTSTEFKFSVSGIET